MLLGMALGLGGCSQTDQARIHAVQGPIMGTQYHVKLVLTSDQESLLPELGQGIAERLKEVDRLMSTYKSDSEISRFNRLRSTDWFELSDMTYEVIAESQRISRETGGAFDITVGPLVNLWGFGPQRRLDEVPDEAELARARSLVGYQLLELRDEPRAIRKTNPELYVDLSAIAKGYSVDQVAEYLQGRGIANFLVEVGGEIRVSGHKPGGESWKLAIEDPETHVRSVHRIIQLTDVGMATSGDYRNYFEAGGKRYSHTLDPRTGYPIEHSLASVSVIHPSSATADALATAFMVMGTQPALEYAVEHHIAAYFIDREGEGFKSRFTPAFESYLQHREE